MAKNVSNNYPYKATNGVTVTLEQAQRGIDDSVTDIKLARAIAEAHRVAGKPTKGNGSGLAVSQKKAVSLYGVRRFPVTFYREEWEAIFARKDEIMAFIAENEGVLATKSGDEE